VANFGTTKVGRERVRKKGMKQRLASKKNQVIIKGKARRPLRREKKGKGRPEKKKKGGD